MIGFPATSVSTIAVLKGQFQAFGQNFDFLRKSVILCHSPVSKRVGSFKTKTLPNQGKPSEMLARSRHCEVILDFGFRFWIVNGPISMIRGPRSRVRKPAGSFLAETVSRKDGGLKKRIEFPVLSERKALPGFCHFAARAMRPDGVFVL